EIIQRKALGRTAQIGFLYDAIRDTFHGTSIFRKELPPGLIKQVSPYNINLSFECEDTYREKFNKLDVEGQLRLNVLSGLLALERTGEYLSNVKDSYKIIKGTLVCKTILFMDYLELNYDTLKPCISTDPFSIQDATHVVTSIKWGANVIVSFDYKNEDKKKRSEIKVAFESNLDKISTCIGASGGSHLEKDKENSYSKNFIAELPLEIQKQTNGKGVPIEYTLYPLSKIAKSVKLDIAIDRMIMSLSEETISRVENIFDDLSESKCMLKDLYDDAQSIYGHILDEVWNKINKTMQNFNLEEAKFRNDLAKCLIEVRSGRSDISEIEILLQKFQNSVLSTNCTTKFIHQYRNISEKASLIRNLKSKNVEYIDKDSTIEKFLHYNDVYILLDPDEYIISGNSSPERIRFKDLYENSNSSLSKFLIAELKICTKIKGPDCPVVRHYVNGKLADNYYCDEINILLLGETGVGKSTFINAFANYLKFGSLDSAKCGKMEVLIPFFFTITDEKYENEETVKIESDDLNDSNERLEKGASSTLGCKCYIFHATDNRIIKLIDTPGIGDTRGVDQDAKNFENILMHISYYPYLNGICILFKPNQSRMSLILKYCLHELLSHLPKSAKDNIFFCFTHSRGSSYHPGGTLFLLRKELDIFKETSNVEITFNKETIFCFDNESFQFLAQIKRGVKFTKNDEEQFKKSWEKSVEESARLIEHIINRQPHKVKDTLSLNNSRQMVKILLNSLAEIQVRIADSINDINMEQKEIQESNKTIKELKEEIYIKKLEIEEKVLEYPRTICTGDTCTEEFQIDGKKQQIYKICCNNCHLNVKSKNLGRIILLFCSAIRFNGKCKFCQCSWKQHIHTAHITTCTPTQSINPDIEFKINEKLSDAEQKQIRIKDLQNLVDQIVKEKESIIKIQNKFAKFLIQNTMSLYNVTFIQYVDKLVEYEKKKFDDERIKAERIKVFENMKDEYSKIERVINEAAKNSNFSNDNNLKNIAELEKELYALPLYGQILKVAKLEEENNQENGFRYAEKHYELFNDNGSSKLKISHVFVKMLNKFNETQSSLVKRNKQSDKSR
ncbi:23818_t:CDS:2, partial [Racocetra persica]